MRVGGLREPVGGLEVRRTIERDMSRSILIFSQTRRQYTMLPARTPQDQTPMETALIEARLACLSDLLTLVLVQVLQALATADMTSTRICWSPAAADDAFSSMRTVYPSPKTAQTLLPSPTSTRTLLRRTTWVDREHSTSGERTSPLMIHSPR